MEYDMGFVAADRRPMTQRDRYVEMVETFLESGDECIVRECADAKEAAAIQSTLSRAIQGMGASCHRSGSVVYVVRDDG